MKKVLVFVNPHSRQGSQCLSEVEAWLLANDVKVLNDTKNSQDTHALMRKFQNEVDAVIVGGGDGSIRDALPGLMETKLPLLIMRLGTANNLAFTLETPTDTNACLQLLFSGKVRELDVGVVNGIPFMTVVGLGLSTQVNRLTRGHWKRLLGVFAFALTAFKVALRMNPFRIEVECDGKIHHARSWQVTICNGKTYGSNIPVDENASLLDNQLHGISSEAKSLWQAFTLAPHLLRGKFPEEVPISQFKGQVIRVKTRHLHHADVDGDVKTSTPLEITVKPRALKVLVN